MRVFSVLLLLTLFAACGEAERDVARSTAPVWTEHRVPERGATVSLPAGWAPARESLTPDLANPLEVFSAANFPLRHHPAECEHMPSALNDLGTSGVLVTVLERSEDTGDYPPRPERFAPHPEPSQVECAPDPGEGELHWFSFSDGGRRFYGLVAYGPAATADDRAKGFEILTRARYRGSGGRN